MGFRIVLFLIEVIVLLYSLKSGWWLSVLQNLPFIGWVSDVVANYWGLSGIMSYAPYQNFIEELLKALLFTAIFGVVDRICRKFGEIVVGKHAYRSGFNIAVDKIVISLISCLASALITAAIMEYCYGWLNAQLMGYAVWVQRLIKAGIVGVVVAVFFLIIQGSVILILARFFTEYIVPTIFRILIIEGFVAAAYIILNVPGVIESTLEIVLLIVAILLLIGSVFGVESYEKSINSYWTRGKHF